MSVDAKTVAALRAATGVGMMECKKALEECDSDLEKAKEYLRKRGREVARKKSGRTTKNGWIGHYVHHNGRVGVLVELRCETDFVAKQEIFQTLLRDLCHQIAFSSPLAIRREEIPEEIIAKEREIYKEQVPPGKPAAIAEKIVDGKVDAFLKERCLLEQPFIRDTKVTVKELLDQCVQKTGENVAVARFVRYELGEDDQG